MQAEPLRRLKSAVADRYRIERELGTGGLRARSGQEYIQPTVLAILAAAIGESDEALKLVQQATEERDAYLSITAVCWPSAARLRAVLGTPRS